MNKRDIAEEKYVCRKCIQDSGLQEVVDKHAEKVKCSYCNARKAALLEHVIDWMRSAIGTVYGALEDNLTVDGQVPDDHYQIEEVLTQLDFRVESEELKADIESAFAEEFFTVDRENSYLRWVPHDAWRDFTKLVKHERRYTFSTWGEPLGPELDELMWSPRNVLGNIAKLIEQLSLVVEVEPGTRFWRVRVHEADNRPEMPKGYTSPPAEHARYSNRMSPAGVPMFYGTDDFETAVLETTDPEHDTANKVATGIQFAAKSKLSVLDLTTLPEQGSFFSDWDLWKRIGVGFLSSFVADVSKPIKKDGREHIEYVPTQVFTEFVRHEIELPGDDKIDGIKYQSSKNGSGCYVLFVEQAGCLPASGDRPTRQLLEAVPAALQTATCKWCLPDPKGTRGTERTKSRHLHAEGDA